MTLPNVTAGAWYRGKEGYNPLMAPRQKGRQQTNKNPKGREQARELPTHNSMNSD